MAIRGTASTVGTASNIETSEWTITPEQFSHHFAHYCRLVPPGHLLSQEKAGEIFLHEMKVHPQQFAFIWKLSDVGGDGYLDPAEFSVAMHLVQRWQQGSVLPASLPSSLACSCQEAKRPQLPVANEERILKYRKAFEAFQKKIKKGVLSGEAAGYIMDRSNLSKDQLSHIWKLADRDQDGHLTFPEFTIAMHLIFVSKLGFTLPTDLDPSSVLPPSFQQVMAEMEQVEREHAHWNSQPNTPSNMTYVHPSPDQTHGTYVYSNEDSHRTSSDGHMTDHMTSNNYDHINNQPPQRFQIRTGNRRGLVNGGGYQGSQESLDPPLSKLSTIPEENFADDLSQDNALPKSQECSQESTGFRTNNFEVNGLSSQPCSCPEEPEGEHGVPWYAVETSQELWQTTPAYHREEVWPVGGAGEMRKVQKMLVTEETIPVLQVALAVDLTASRDCDRVISDSDSDKGAREALTNEDLEELEKISQASQKFLSVNSEGQKGDRNAQFSVDTNDFRAISNRGLQATIQDMEAKSKQSNGFDEPAEPVTDFDGSKEEMMMKLEDLETEVLTSLADVVDSESMKRVDKSYDHAKRSHGPSTRPSEEQKSPTNQQSSSVPHPLKPHPPIIISRSKFQGVQDSSQSGVTPVGDLVICSHTAELKVPKKTKAAVMDDFLEGELADINEMFHEFEVKDKKKEQRTQAELEEIEKLKAKSSHVVELAPPVNSLEEVAKRRSMESTTIEEQWKKEMQALEDERLQALQQQKPEIDPETDIVLQNLDNELQSLIHDKEEEVKLTQQEKVLRAEREKEERERKERERREKIANTETPEVLTVEEWITWMEEKKKQGMTPAQLEEYEHRKKVWQQKEKEREEKRRQEEEEQKRKTRQKMESEMRLYRERQIEVKESRLTEEELHLKQEEMARRNAEESRLRKERAQKFRMEEKQRELEEMRPKAKSALAAKWEESVKSRSIGKSMTRDQHRATVLTGNIKIEETQSLEREEERLIRRISGSFPNGTAKNSQKRNSVQ